MTIFQQRLESLGFKNYDEYLKSEWWKKIKEKYKKSKYLQCCIVCGNKNYILHHRSYAKLGHEHLNDFIPLCRKHHKEIHKYLKSNGVFVQGSKRAIRKLYSITKKDLRRRLLNSPKNKFVSKRSKKVKKLIKKYPVIKTNKKWWDSLDGRDKKAFIIGFDKNKRAEEIQKQEIESNRRRYKTTWNY